MARLESITLRGFKTFRELAEFKPGPITVLIGPNGAGKSNFVSFFRLLSRVLVPPGQLQEHVAKLGGASAILHDGPARTREITARLLVGSSNAPARLGLGSLEEEIEYSFTLAYAAGDTLVFTEERYRDLQRSGAVDPPWTIFTAGHREPELIKAAGVGAEPASTISTPNKGFVRRVAESGRAKDTAQSILQFLQDLTVYQFHDTSEVSRIRQKWSVEDGQGLKEDAGNLAPFLYRLKQQYPQYYARISETIRLILPFFAEFDLKPEFGRLLLAWRERGTDRVFTASQAADGMLRTMALVALLQQPESDLPDVIIMDEPELGLHPYAIEVLAGLIRAASQHSQVILATQSVSLVDRFSPEDIVVADRLGRESTFRRRTEAELHDWLAEYTMSELWEKNVIGGRPS